MKTLLLAGLLLSNLAAKAQILGKVLPDGYVSKMGTPVHKGDSIHFALGQREDGTFKYAEIVPNMMMPQGGGLPKIWANHAAIVKEVRGFGTTRKVVFKAGIYNATLDFDAAEQAGEIKTANSQQKATPSTSAGVADELLKLKKLAHLRKRNLIRRKQSC
jgi:hypothetical protein